MISSLMRNPIINGGFSFEVLSSTGILTLFLVISDTQEPEL